MLVHYTCEVYNHPVTPSYQVIELICLYYILVRGDQVRVLARASTCYKNLVY